MEEALLIAQVAIFAPGFIYIFKRDRIFGLYFLFIFVYIIFAEIGYKYFPELSETIQAYFGPEVWLPAVIFVTLSMLAFVFAFAFLRGPMHDLIPFSLQVQKRPNPKTSKRIAIGIASVAMLYVLGYAILTPTEISWYTAQDPELASDNPAFALFIFIFKNLTSVSIAHYCIFREEGALRNNKALAAFAAFIFGTYLFIAVKLGNRTDLLSFCLSAMVYESYRTKFTFAKIAKFAAFLVLAALLISVVELLRYRETPEIQTDIAALLIAKDYYAPAHMLYAAIANNLIDPANTILSNICNSLVMLNYPYLQQTVTDSFLPGLASRSQGYAFFIFTEGYLFMGPLGFIYNGLVLVMMMTFWRKLASTNNPAFNVALLAFMGSMLVGVTRGQSAYFIKGLYTYILFSGAYYIAITGITLRLRFHFGGYQRARLDNLALRTA